MAVIAGTMQAEAVVALTVVVLLLSVAAAAAAVPLEEEGEEGAQRLPLDFPQQGVMEGIQASEEEEEEAVE
jgi:hypothetical protein